MLDNDNDNDDDKERPEDLRSEALVTDPCAPTYKKSTTKNTIQIEVSMARARPVFLDLTQIRLPIMGFVSILHRISGVVLVLAIPVAALLLGRSLASPQGFASVAELLDSWLMLLPLLVLIWALLHHLFAGIRYLVMDLGMALDLQPARLSAQIALVAGLVATLIVAGVVL